MPKFDLFDEFGERIGTAKEVPDSTGYGFVAYIFIIFIIGGGAIAGWPIVLKAVNEDPNIFIIIWLISFPIISISTGLMLSSKPHNRKRWLALYFPIYFTTVLVSFVIGMMVKEKTDPAWAVVFLSIILSFASSLIGFLVAVMNSKK